MKSTIKFWVIVILAAVTFSSCTVTMQKRLYRKGYHIETLSQKNKRHSRSNTTGLPEKTTVKSEVDDEANKDLALNKESASNNSNQEVNRPTSIKKDGTKDLTPTNLHTSDNSVQSIGPSVKWHKYTKKNKIKNQPKGIKKEKAPKAWLLANILSFVMGILAVILVILGVIFGVAVAIAGGGAAVLLGLMISGMVLGAAAIVVGALGIVKGGLRVFGILGIILGGIALIGGIILLVI